MGLALHRTGAGRSESVVTKAVLNASDLLGLTGAELAKVIGVSPSRVTRMKQGQALAYDKEAYIRSLMFIRIYRSLAAILGGDDQAMRAWFGSENRHLHGEPKSLVQTIQGITHVADYLDAMRGK